MMDKPRWIPGPWRIERGVYGGWTIQDDSLEITICSRAPWPSKQVTSEANATLISAAPDLAKAAEPFLHELDGLEHEPDDLPFGVFTNALTVGDLRALAAAYRKAIGET